MTDPRAPMSPSNLRDVKVAEYVPEKRPRYESFHSGVVAWTHVALLLIVAAAATWVATEVRALREALTVQETHTEPK